MHDKEVEEEILSLFNNKKTKKEGFTLLVNHFKKSIYFQIRRIAISHDNTDDVVQEVFIKCWNKLNTFNGKSKLSTWIYRVAYNEAIQWIRKNKKEHHLNILEILRVDGAKRFFEGSLIKDIAASFNCCSKVFDSYALFNSFGQDFEAHTMAKCILGSPIGRRISCSMV